MMLVMCEPIYCRLRLVSGPYMSLYKFPPFWEQYFSPTHAYVRRLVGYCFVLGKAPVFSGLFSVSQREIYEEAYRDPYYSHLRRIPIYILRPYLGLACRSRLLKSCERTTRRRECSSGGLLIRNQRHEFQICSESHPQKANLNPAKAHVSHGQNSLSKA